jgi:hypothetical protein
MERKGELGACNAENRWPASYQQPGRSGRQGAKATEPFGNSNRSLQAVDSSASISTVTKQPAAPPAATSDLSLFVEAIEVMRQGEPQAASPALDPEGTRKRSNDVPPGPAPQAKKSHVALKPPSGPTPQGIQLQEYDILAGNRSKRVGNRRYRDIIRECAVHVGGMEMRAVVAKVLEDIAPGRFVRVEGDSYAWLKEKDVIKKINNALRDTAGLYRKALERGVSNTSRKTSPGAVKITPSSHTNKFKTRTTDVLGGYARENNPGNLFFQELVVQHLTDFGTKNQEVVISRIIAAVYRQTPAGRFLSPSNQSVLSEAEVKAKVWVALNHEHQLTLEREEFMDSNGGAVSQARFDSVMSAAAAVSGDFRPFPRFQLRTSDVLGGLGKLKSNPGNVLFRDLVTQYVDDFEASSQVAITTIMEAIRSQDPPGRFLTSDNQSTLSKSQARNKVRLALHNKFNKKRQEAKNQSQSPSLMTPIDDVTTAGGKPSTAGPTEGHNEVANSIPRRIAKAQPIVHQSTDILGELVRGQQSNPGNLFFNGLVAKHGATFYSSNQNAIIQQIVDAVHNLSPPGRFLSSNNKAVLDKAKIHAKVWVALNREHQLLLEKAIHRESSGAPFQGLVPDPVSVSSGSDEEGLSISRSPIEGGSAKKETPRTKRVLQSVMGWSIPGRTSGTDE